MSSNELEDALKTTFLDYTLSRGEKQGLTRIIQKLAGDEHRISVARSYAFQLAREQLIGSQQQAVVDWLEDVMKVLAPMHDSGGSDDRAEAYFSPHDPCVNKITRLFQESRHQVDICVFTITDDRIRRAIEEAYQRRVRIRILSDDDKAGDLGSDIDFLERVGVSVRVDRSAFHMHHKFALFDQRTLMTGSYNWTRSAAENNQENFVVTTDGSLIRSFQNAFDQLWRNYA
jgi:phosphatidylserine/phosphatidylglycerophosphate/cardiolipin synthase-like enzyme